MIPLLNGYMPPQQEIINLINEKKPAIVEQVKEPTLEEKIAQNYYKCDELTHWIRADNAQCLAKQPEVAQTTQVTTQAQKPVRGAVNASGNGYEPGQCTFWVKSKRPDIPNNWGNASSWLANAKAQGWSTGRTPQAGAVGWTSGHVVYIESVGPEGMVTYSDMNGRYIPFEVGGGTVPASKYIYIY